VTGKFLGFNNSSNSDLEWNEKEDDCLWKYGQNTNYGVLYYFCGGDSSTHTCSRKRVVHSVMDPLKVLGEGKFGSVVFDDSIITVSPVDPPYLHCNSDNTGIQKDIVAVSGITIDSNSIQADFKKNSFSFKVNADITDTDLFRLAISKCSAGVYKLTDSSTNSITIRLKPKKSLSDVFKIHTIPEDIALFNTDTAADDNFYTTLDGDVDVCWIRTTDPNVFYAPALNKQIY
jgi:hypothetical protein